MSRQRIVVTEKILEYTADVFTKSKFWQLERKTNMHKLVEREWKNDAIMLHAFYIQY